MPNQQNGARTELHIRAYTAGYQEASRPLGSKRLHQHAYRFTYRMLGDHPPRWMYHLVMAAYQQGWRDHIAGLPCQPFPDCP